MSKTAITIGPNDQGRRMSLEEFDRAEGQPGRLYELNRGEVVVTDVPKPRHLVMVNALRRQLFAYDHSHPGRISVAAVVECKILLEAAQSERHPDLAVYKTPPPVEDEDVWSSWVPEIVVEVVSPSSRHRDLVEKREEYLAFGVLEYWVLDADRSELLALRRSRGEWVERTVRPPGTYATRLLPGFLLETTPLFPDEVGA